LYYLIRYRRKVVSENIKNSLHSLSKEAQIRVEKQFYRDFCDTLVETLKLVSISKETLKKHISVDYSELENTLAQNQNCHIYLGHQFNWEWANAHISSTLKAPVIVVYKPIKNKALDVVTKKVRGRFGSKLVSSKNMRKEIEELNLKPHVLVLAADQNPKTPMKSFWTTFLSQKTAFMSGTELYTASNKTTSYYANFIRVKRGYYQFVLTPLFDFSKPYKIGLITSLFAKKMETEILRNPENYLWSHRRWKHEYKEDYKKRWMDTSVPF
jgi:KDO2-lipid IV(A) lauroyltransferase